MDDQQIVERINELAHQEHALWEAESKGEASDGERERLQELQVTLDQCWDLLRQRQGHEEFGLDPDNTSVRDESTVEGYEQ